MRFLNLLVIAVVTLVSLSVSAKAISLVSVASATEDQKLSAVLKFVFNNEAQKHGAPANYVSLWCPKNIFNLLRRLDQAHVDLSKAKVWYILPQSMAGNSGVQQSGESVLHPKLPRPGPADSDVEWSFHVVVEIEGHVLDLDYTSHPEVVSKLEYAKLMWQKGPGLSKPDPQKLFTRVIPAKDYLSSYSGNWSWYAAGGGGRYPAVDFNSLL